MSDFDRWNDASAAARERMATGIASEDMLFTGLNEKGRGRFECDGRAFLFVPGRTFQLGWNREALRLTAEQRRTWRDGLASLWGFDGTPEELLEDNYSSSRTVELESLLVQQTAEPTVVDDLFYDEDGDELDDGPFDVLKALLGSTFRLPTADEWEYLYRAGARTLFPWGDHWPAGSAYDHRRGSDVVQDPNAFGLSFDYDTYWTEVIESELRGGDGGGDVCGGAPTPVDWRSLGCAYRPPVELWTELLEISLEQSTFRRVRSVTLSP